MTRNGTPPSEGDLMAMVAKRYAPPEWAFLRQVRNGTGYSRRERYADGLALNCYPSRGMELHGFEAKISRSDWIRELRDPDKSAPIQAYCDRWWIVAPADMIHPSELPPTWGLLVPPRRGIKLRVIVEAPKLPEPRKALDRPFVASVLREAARLEMTSDLLEKAHAEGCEEERAHAAGLAERAVRHEHSEAERLRSMISAFEQASGLHLNPWDAGRIGEAVQVVLEKRLDVVQQLRQELHRLKCARVVIERGLEEIERK